MRWLQWLADEDLLAVNPPLAAQRRPHVRDRRDGRSRRSGGRTRCSPRRPSARRSPTGARWTPCSRISGRSCAATASRPWARTLERRTTGSAPTTPSARACASWRASRSDWRAVPTKPTRCSRMPWTSPWRSSSTRRPRSPSSSEAASPPTAATGRWPPAPLTRPWRSWGTAPTTSTGAVLVVFAWAARVAAHRRDVPAAEALLARATRALRPLLTYALPVHVRSAPSSRWPGPTSPSVTSREAAGVIRQAREHPPAPSGPGASWRRTSRPCRPYPGGGSSLTAAELRVVPLLASHLTLQEIADRLFVSRHTVKTALDLDLPKARRVVVRRGRRVRLQEMGLLVTLAVDAVSDRDRDAQLAARAVEVVVVRGASRCDAPRKASSLVIGQGHVVRPVGSKSMSSITQDHAGVARVEAASAHDGRGAVDRRCRSDARARRRTARRLPIDHLRS